MSDQARAIVSEFGQQDGVGEKVMKLLEERREREDNWAYDYWLRDMYLNVRWGCLLEVSTGLSQCPEIITDGQFQFP